MQAGSSSTIVKQTSTFYRLIFLALRSAALLAIFSLAGFPLSFFQPRLEASFCLRLGPVWSLSLVRSSPTSSLSLSSRRSYHSLSPVLDSFHSPYCSGNGCRRTG